MIIFLFLSILSVVAVGVFCCLISSGRRGKEEKRLMKEDAWKR